MGRILGMLFLALELSFSIGLPLICLLIYMDYAKTNGIRLETGCEGPGIPFGMLSGIIFAVILRFKSAHRLSDQEQDT